MTLVQFDSNKDVISKHKPLFDRIAGKIDEDTFILSGGRSSFKSYDITLAILIDTIVHASRGIVTNSAVFMNKQEDLRDGAFKLFKNVIRNLGMEKDFITREKPMLVRYKNGAEIKFYGLNMQQGKKGNAVSNLIWKWYEECDQFDSPETIKSTDDTLLRNGIKGERIKTALSYNPPKNKHHWIFEFVKNKKALKIHTTYLDDDTKLGILNEQQLQEIESMKITDYAWYVWNYLGIVPENAEVDFPSPVVATEKLELTEHDYIFAGIDSATKGKDSTMLCLMAYNTETYTFKLIGFQTFDDEWIDGYTSYKVGADVTAVLMQANVNSVYIDPAHGQHIIDYVATHSDGITVGSIDFGSSVSDKAKGKTALALNKRAEMYLNTSEQLRNRKVVSYCESNELSKELDATEFITDARKIKVIPKDVIKSRIGKSPDYADSFVLCIQAIYDFML
ncbi:phage terminase large subunit [Enterococcus sp. AZ177]|uniref:phage terminase large subunit n=1 Tax=unclassified Enterococcus TaxID=2608891 RepID=UPI003D2FC0F6